MKLFQLGQRLLYPFSKIDISHIPTLQEYLSKVNTDINSGPKFHIETYGCQMNSNDSQIVTSILQQSGYSLSSIEDAEIIFLNTCAIRAHAENKVMTRLSQLKGQKKILGLLGCMAERLKKQLWENGAHIVAGPDSYRMLPEMIQQHRESNQLQSQTQLSQHETYDDIMPFGNPEDKTTFVSVMRGCNNMCSFCIVPLTRGRERSRDPQTIIKEISNLDAQGIREVTLLGQNVNSYFYEEESIPRQHQNSPGFQELYKLRHGNGYSFAKLLDMLALQFPNIRFRFTSPHPKDFPDELLQVIAMHPNIAKCLHIPFQSGSNEILQKMRRYYTREAVISLAERARKIIPGVGLTTDVIVGFCGETEKDFEDTLDLMKQIEFEHAYMFAYSMRERTHAHRNYVDDVTKEEKQTRLAILIDQVHQIQNKNNQTEIGKRHLILIDQKGKNQNQLKGRTDSNKSVIIEDVNSEISFGDFVEVEITKATLKTLFGKPIAKTTMQTFVHSHI